MPIVDASVCVFCRRHPIQQEHRPFCSDRCRLQDLAQWATGSYRSAGDAVADAADTQQSELKHSTPEHG
ncbi:MAG: DNA gyrase inhibitor YacG [Acidobacteriia bacterium]|nr:DNA gyrase inhibitor YacG [Terriglobia bacterium]